VNKARELVNGERARRAVRFQLATNGARARVDSRRCPRVG
jgi:hypothetical protein